MASGDDNKGRRPVLSSESICSAGWNWTMLSCLAVPGVAVDFSGSTETVLGLGKPLYMHQHTFLNLYYGVCWAVGMKPARWGNGSAKDCPPSGSIWRRDQKQRHPVSSMLLDHSASVKCIHTASSLLPPPPTLTPTLHRNVGVRTRDFCSFVLTT